MAGIMQCIVMFAITAVFTYVCCLFAFQMGMIIIAILLCLNTIGVGIAFAQSAKEFAKMEVHQQLMGTLDSIEGAVASGDISFGQGVHAASVAFDLHSSAIDAINSWDK